MTTFKFRLSAALGGALLAFLQAGCSKPASTPPPAPQTSAGITGTLSVSPWPAHSGDDTLVITLLDSATARPIGDANVTASAEAQSPRLPGQEVSGRAQGNGVYDVPVVLGIATNYLIQVRAERPAHQTATFSFPINAPS
jgi:hypothetical protein